MSSGPIRAGQAFVELFADDSQLRRDLNGARRRLQAYGSQINAMGASLIRTGTMAAAPMALSLGIFANFADEMSKVKAVSAGTEAEFEKLTEKAKELGRTTSFSASQVAAGMVELGRAGFNRAEIDNAIAAVMDLSRATSTELPEATAIAGATLRQFGMDSSEMARVADVLTATANGSSQSLIDLGEALKPVAPIAVEAGASLEDVNAAVAILANMGIKGSLAGNALARAYKNLSTTATQDVLKEIGVSAVDSSGNLRSLADIIADVDSATKEMGNAERLAIFETLFGRGQAAALKLASNTEAVADMVAKLEQSQGQAAATAREMDNNLGGFFREFMSMVEGVAISIGEALAPELIAMKADILSLGQAVTTWIGANRETVVLLAKLAAGAIASGGALVAIGTALSIIGSSIGAITTLASGIAALKVASAFSFAGGPWILGLTAVLSLISQLRSAQAEYNAELAKGNQLNDKWTNDRTKGQTGRINEAMEAEKKQKGSGKAMLQDELSRLKAQGDSAYGALDNHKKFGDRGKVFGDDASKEFFRRQNDLQNKLDSIEAREKMVREALAKIDQGQIEQGQPQQLSPEATQQGIDSGFIRPDGRDGRPTTAKPQTLSDEDRQAGIASGFIKPNSDAEQAWLDQVNQINSKVDPRIEGLMAGNFESSSASNASHAATEGTFSSMAGQMFRGLSPEEQKQDQMLEYLKNANRHLMRIANETEDANTYGQ